MFSSAFFHLPVYQNYANNTSFYEANTGHASFYFQLSLFCLSKGTQMFIHYSVARTLGAELTSGHADFLLFQELTFIKLLPPEGKHD